MADSLPVDLQSCAVDGGYSGRETVYAWMHNCTVSGGSDLYLFAEPDDLWARTLKEDLDAAQRNRDVDAELERDEGREAEGDG